MKKLIVLLLAFAMVGAVSAQVTTAVALSGGITLVNDAGQSAFARDGSGYDTITFKGSEKDESMVSRRPKTWLNDSPKHYWRLNRGMLDTRASMRRTPCNTSNGTFRAYSLNTGNGF